MRLVVVNALFLAVGQKITSLSTMNPTVVNAKILVISFILTFGVHSPTVAVLTQK